MKILIIMLVLILLYLFFIAPNTSRKNQMEPYEKAYIAHRGLFNNKDIPENSLPAFQKAVDNGYGIELDVQITLDDKLVVFHDGNLQRMTGVDKMLIDCTYEELQQYHLLDTDEKIPLFSEVLAVLHKDTPLVTEIKTEGRNILNTKMTVQMLREYGGLFNIESFNPNVVRYLKNNEPDIIRGQLSYDSLKNKENGVPLILRFFTTNLLTNFLTRPDYIAYDINSSDNLSFRLISRLFKGECVAWTVKNPEQLKKAEEYYQSIIFDSFIPDKEKL